MNEQQLLDYTDYPRVRQDLRDKVLKAVQESPPAVNEQFTLRVVNPKFSGKDSFSLKDQKKAILAGQSLSDKLVGNYELVDNATGTVVGRTNQKRLMNVPHLTDRGTYIRKGVEYTIAKQFRLVPGVYTRVTDDGNIEAQFNAKPRTGSSFRVYMEPGSGHFFMRYKGRKVPMYPVLRAMGIPHERIEKTWGKELAEKNKALQNSPYAVNFLKQFRPQRDEAREELIKAVGFKNMDKQASETDYDPEFQANVIGEFSRTELSPRVTRRTLGTEYMNATPEAIMAATTKILNVGKGKADTDSRDSLAYQDIYDVSDFLAEKIKNDQGGALRKVLWKLTGRGQDMKKIPPSLLDAHVSHLFTATGVAQAIEEINPSDIYDQNVRVSRLGEGALPSIDSAPKESRNVQPSYLGYIDPVVAPESLRIGLDMRLARNVRRGPDRQLYTQLINAKTGKKEWVGVRDATEANIGMPGSSEPGDSYVPTLSKGRDMKYVHKKDLDYLLPDGDEMFSDTANLVPLKSGVKGMRLLMGNKFARQALPLVGRQAPLVRTSNPKGGSEEERMGVYMGAVKASKPGVVKAVYKDHLKMSYDDGTEETIDLYDNHPYARKTFIRNTPKVKAGQKVGKGAVLATSNYTDPDGVSALGTNLRVAYLNYDGKVFEDAVVISQSAAKEKLTSEHMYTTKFEKDKDVFTDKAKFQALYPSRFSKSQLGTIGDDGVVKTGTVVNYGDPMVLAVKEREPTPQSMGRKTRTDDSVVWKHEFPAVVTDAEPSKKGYNINVRANVPMEEGDKLSGRFGNKGVVAEVIRDEDMPRDSKGRPIDVIFSPLGIHSRTNPAQKSEVVLGKVAEKTGKPYVLPGFLDEDMKKFAAREAYKNNVKANEDLYDPKTGKTIPGILTGMTYVYKLQHTAEGKGKSRGTSRYTAEDQPARGGKEGAKHLGDMEIQALQAHGADQVLKDLKIIKGQKNSNFWRQLKLGETPTQPDTPLVYQKFKSLIRAAGINLHEDKDKDSVFAMTNNQAEALTGAREIKNPSTYDAKNLRPIPGGLFDPEATGSMGNGDKWSYIKLPAPMPNPIMSEPLRRILGMKQKEFDDMVAGNTEVEGRSGSEALSYMLSRVNMPSLKQRTLEQIKHGAKSKRDDAVKLFRYIDAMEKHDVKPEDFLMTRVPVLPPRFRPISRQSDMTMVADPNYLYKTLLENIQDYKDTDGMPKDIRSEAWGNVWKSYNTLVGMTDPDQEQLQQKNVGGMLKQIFGKGSPKFGFVQRRVIGTNIDVSGLGVVAPNPSLKLNQIGMPEKLAWNLYGDFVVREMVGKGYPATQAAKAVEAKSPPAYKALQSVIKKRPVLVNRAPTLHKYSNMAFTPVLTKGKTIQVSPTIVGPFAMDFDGDTASFTVPVSQKAVDQANELMMPEKNLISSRFGKPAYTPSNEYLQGLYFATKPPKKGQTRIFKSMQEAMMAFSRGEITIDDPIRVVED